MSGELIVGRMQEALDGLDAVDAVELLLQLGCGGRHRQALVDVQRHFAANPPGGAAGAVLDGRDIGTVICPDADHKFFIDADIEERARRRVKELQDRGDPSIPARVLQEMKERDERDRTRAVAPLAPAADASVVDTTNLNADAAFALAMSFIR